MTRIGILTSCRFCASNVLRDNGIDPDRQDIRWMTRPEDIASWTHDFADMSDVCSDAPASAQVTRMVREAAHQAHLRGKRLLGVTNLLDTLNGQ